MDPAVAADTIETLGARLRSAADDHATRSDLGDLVTGNLDRILVTR